MVQEETQWKEMKRFVLSTATRVGHISRVQIVAGRVKVIAQFYS